VPKRPSQNCTAPSWSPLTSVPSVSTSRAHTQGGELLLVPTVMRCCSVPGMTERTAGATQGQQVEKRKGCV
jgi:hypothetical protein